MLDAVAFVLREVVKGFPAFVFFHAFYVTRSCISKENFHSSQQTSLFTHTREQTKKQLNKKSRANAIGIRVCPNSMPRELADHTQARICHSVCPLRSLGPTVYR